MRLWKMCCLLLTLAFMTGCGKSLQTAHELAAPNLYKDAAYENASQSGPSVMVLPGRVACASYEFLAQVKPDNLREFGELELGKANFKVVDQNSMANIYQEIAVAANLGDGSVAKRFGKHKITPPQWLVIFDVTDVQSQTTAFSFTDKNSANFAGALMGGMLGGSSGAQLGQGVIGSINSAKEQRQWNITLQYRILDGETGQQLQQGSLTEQASLNNELKGFLGVDAAQAGGLALSTVAQRLIQKAVAEIDKQYKLPAMAQAETKTAHKPGAGKAAKAGKAERLASAHAASTPDKPEIVCTSKNLGTFACQIPAQWSMGTPPRAVEVAVAQKPELGRLLESSSRGDKSSLIDSIVAFDILRTAGPLVTLSEPGSPLAKVGQAMALSGGDLEGRVFILPGAAGQLPPEKLAAAVLGHLRNAVVVEPLGVETVAAKDGQRSVAVFKYIKVERHKELKEKPDYDRDAKDEYTLTSIPHYHNMAMAIVPKGNDLLLVIVIAPEGKFLPQLEGVKRLVASAS
ncbi:hypothetical protein [Desulfovibrio sp. TomC]|uniref:hypothetical protein n=1 Tax=Desulfovibrio sp. TomC TaxID=1562888 RepID=UPI0005732D36|nr:hypothetical protein [Desulfovibrio sp. TomC]KHK02920.1 hypothetical protein NY78_1449 [Desulfovibrio sp. TomC]